MDDKHQCLVGTLSLSSYFPLSPKSPTQHKILLSHNRWEKTSGFFLITKIKNFRVDQMMFMLEFLTTFSPSPILRACSSAQSTGLEGRKSQKAGQKVRPLSLINTVTHWGGKKVERQVAFFLSKHISCTQSNSTLVRDWIATVWMQCNMPRSKSEVHMLPCQKLLYMSH